jgi:hypothetical protein
MFNLFSDGSESGSKKRKRGFGSVNDGVWRRLRLEGDRSLVSGGRFCVGANGRNLTSVTVKMFSYSHFIKKSYTFCDSIRLAKIMLQ